MAVPVISAAVFVIIVIMILGVVAVAAMSIWLAYRLLLIGRNRSIPPTDTTNDHSTRMLAGYGFKIFIALLALAVFELLLIVAFAAFTYPVQDGTLSLIPPTS